MKNIEWNSREFGCETVVNRRSHGLRVFFIFCFLIVIGSWRSEAQTLLTVGFEITPPSAQNFRTITEALNAVNTMEGKYEIWVKRGKYAEDELFVFGNVEMYGGFVGKEEKRSQRSTNAELTILDGSLIHRIASVSGLIDGFRIENGREKGCGGGIRLLGGTIQNCIIQNNEAGEWGGGVYCEGYVNVVQNSVIRYNVCKQDTTVIIGWWKGKGNSLRKL